jgi:hypothetical protein
LFTKMIEQFAEIASNSEEDDDDEALKKILART